MYVHMAYGMAWPCHKEPRTVVVSFSGYGIWLSRMLAQRAAMAMAALWMAYGIAHRARRTSHDQR
jgi:hypothetical protein